MDNKEIFARTEMPVDVGATVRDIIADVRKSGDAALRKYSARFDGLSDETAIEVSADEIEAAYRACDPELIAVMEEAARNIREYHSKQVREGFEFTKSLDGDQTAGGGADIVLGQLVLPIERVGIYVPGGTASYPSTVLMNVIPAKIAGVREIVFTTPASGGRIKDSILAAAKIGGADRIFRVGGAQAIAALAYGTETVPAVDKITGPGNAFVAEAKRQVSGQVGIDMIAGPSEILIVADAGSDAGCLAIDMLSQAEHDRLATAVLVTDSRELAEKVAAELERLLPSLPREEIARASIDASGKIIVADSIEKAIDIANEIAPEHLELCVEEPLRLLPLVRNAGSVFLGRNCPEALGDYFAGPNHTLPTSGTARFYSPLSVDDFTKRMQYSYYSEAAIGRDGDKIALFAREEGLEAHALSALSRKKEV